MPYRYALRLSGTRKLGNRTVYEVLDEGEGGVEISAHVKGYRKRVGTVAAADRRHIYRAFDSIDGIFDRNTDCFGNHLGACTGVPRSDLNRGRCDPRILSNR